MNATHKQLDVMRKTFADYIAKCGGRGGKPGPCPTGLTTKPKVKPAQAKIKATEAKVATINKQITAAKAKLATLKLRLAAAKADVKKLKGETKAKAKPAPGNAALAAEVKESYHSGVTKEGVAGVVAKLNKSKRSDAVSAAQAIGLKVQPSASKGKIIGEITQRLEARRGAADRMGIIRL